MMLAIITFGTLFFTVMCTTDIAHLTTKDPIIDPAMYEAYHNLLSLDMSNQSAFEFPVNEVVLRHKNLAKYVCNNCGVHSIYWQSLSQLPFLSELSLNNNNLSYVHPDSFAKNEQLRKVQLMDNQLVTFNPEATLRRFTYVSMLYLDGNPGFDINRVDIVFPWLHHFLCEGCNISFVDKSTMSKWPKLVQLHLPNNRLEQVDPDAFDDMDRLKLLNINDNPDLRRLTLRSRTLKWIKVERCGLDGRLDTSSLPALEYISVRGNKITKLEEHGFVNNRELQTVLLDDNMIEKIPEKLLHFQFPKLELLCIDGNPLQPREFLALFVKIYRTRMLRRGCSDDEYPDKQFENYLPSKTGIAYYSKQRSIHTTEGQLKQDLSNRNLVYIEEDFFANMSYVTELILDNNFFDLTQKRAFIQSSSITTLSLANCSITSVSDESLRGLPNLASLDLRQNKLKVLLSTELFLFNPNIRHINLASNEIETIVPDFFYNLRNLTSLNLDGNRMLSSSDERPFLLSSSLQFLSCSHCGFSQIDNMTLFKLTNLNELNFSHNHIAYVDESAFIGMKQLHRLDLQNNKLHRFEPDLNKMPHLATLCLAGNRHLAESMAVTSDINQVIKLEKNCSDRTFSEKLVQIVKHDLSPSVRLAVSRSDKLIEYSTTISELQATEAVPVTVSNGSAMLMSRIMFSLIFVLTFGTYQII